MGMQCQCISNTIITQLIYVRSMARKSPTFSGRALGYSSIYVLFAPPDHIGPSHKSKGQYVACSVRRDQLFTLLVSTDCVKPRFRKSTL